MKTTKSEEPAVDDVLWRVGRDDDNGILLRLGLASDPSLGLARLASVDFDISRVRRLAVPPNVCELEDIAERSDLGLQSVPLMRLGGVFIQRRFATMVLERYPACVWHTVECPADGPVVVSDGGQIVAYVMPVAMTEEELDEAIDRGLATDFDAPYVAEGA